MRTIAMLNKKGGVGKTSACHHLSGELGRRGMRVLLVDVDAQANLTQGLLGPEVARSIDPGATVACLFGDRPLPAARLILPTPIPGVSILPGHAEMERRNDTDPWDRGPVQYVLRDRLGAVRDRYDVCLIDCPPSVQMCSWAALAASGWVVVPLQAEDYGAQGIADVQNSIDHARQAINPDLRLAGYLVSMFNRSLVVHVTYEATLRSIYGDDVFRAMIPLAKDFKEAVMHRHPVCLEKPRSAAARAIAALADELLARIGMGADIQEAA